jgi:hypothetical protein
MKINYPAVLVAGIVHWILGAVWYGIFSTKFIELIAWTPEQLKAVESQNHAKEYILAFLSSLVLVYILAHFIQYTKRYNCCRRAADRVLVVAWFHSYNSTRDSYL